MIRPLSVSKVSKKAKEPSFAFLTSKSYKGVTSDERYELGVLYSTHTISIFRIISHCASPQTCHETYVWFELQHALCNCSL